MTSTPVSDRFIEEDFPSFVAKVRARLEQGKQDYGDSSFTGPLKLQEIQDELEDVAGWASIQWEKLERLKRHMAKVTDDSLNERRHKWRPHADGSMSQVCLDCGERSGVRASEYCRMEELKYLVYNVWDDGDLTSL